MTDRGPILLYRSTCAKCRALSLVVVCVSLGWVRRVPLLSPEATALCAEYSIPPRKVALVGDQRVFAGWRALTGLAGLAVTALRFRLSERHS